MPPFFVPASHTPPAAGCRDGVDGGDRAARGRGKVAAGHAGLVHASNQNRPKISVWGSGSLIEVKMASPQENRRPGKRGKITSFSKSARWAMRKFLARIERGALPVVVGLTYPDVFTPDPARWKADLHALVIRMGRELDRLGGTWKLEFQERGAPHFHLLVWGLEANRPGGRVGKGDVKHRPRHTRKEFREWVSRVWFEVVGSGDEKHLRAGTNVERVRCPNGIQSYVAGYQSKDDQTLVGVEVGKYWGKFGVANLPMVEPEEVELSHDGAWAVARALRKYRENRRKAGWRKQRQRAKVRAIPKSVFPRSFTVICDAGQILGRVPELASGARWTQTREWHPVRGWEANPEHEVFHRHPARGSTPARGSWKRSAAGHPPFFAPPPTSGPHTPSRVGRGEHVLATCGGGVSESVRSYRMPGEYLRARFGAGRPCAARQAGWADVSLPGCVAAVDGEAEDC